MLRESEAKRMASMKGLEVKLDNSQVFRAFVESAHAIVDEGLLVFTKEGLRLMNMDPSSISMVNNFIPNRAFTTWNVPTERIELGLNIDNLHKILTGGRPSSKIDVLRIYPSESEWKLNLDFISEGERETATISIIDIKKSVEKEPKIETPAVMTIDGVKLKEIIKRMSLISCYIGVKAMQTGVLFSARGDSGNLDKVIDRLNKDILKRYNLDGKQDQGVVLNIEFLENMIRPVGKGVDVNLEFKNSEPTRISYVQDEVQTTYYLAPYLE